MKDIYVIVGPTSSGKSDYAVNLAKEFSKKGIVAEIISTDSRQVYKELNLLSGKIKDDEMDGVVHHMISVTSVANDYSAELFAQQSSKIVLDIINRKSVPIICGGTGFYIDALINKLNGFELPKVKPNIELRKKLEVESSEKLFDMLLRLDTDRANNIDKHNRVRIIRALEIIDSLGKVPKNEKNISNKYNFIFIGLDYSDQKLKERIANRLLQRIKDGMIKEADTVYKLIGSEKMASLGLECKYCVELIEKKINTEQLVSKLCTKIWQYAKRQRTYFKKNESILWNRF